MAKDPFRNPVTIAKFDITDTFGNTFCFPGGKFSTVVYSGGLCASSIGAAMQKVGPEHLPSLLELKALTELAIATIENRAAHILKETRDQALTIFYNNLLMSSIGTTYDSIADAYGECVRDVFSLERAVEGGNHIIVDWMNNPEVSGTEKGHTYRGETFRTRIPRSEGIVVPTSDGLYSPVTGMPFSTKRSKPGENPYFWEKVYKKIEESVTDPSMAGLPGRSIVTKMAFAGKNPFPDLDYSDCIHLLRKHATYGFSHMGEGTMLSRGVGFIVVMRGWDRMSGRVDPVCVSLGPNNMGECGISERYIER